MYLVFFSNSFCSRNLFESSGEPEDSEVENGTQNFRNEEVMETIEEVKEENEADFTPFPSSIINLVSMPASHHPTSHQPSSHPLSQPLSTLETIQQVPEEDEDNIEEKQHVEEEHEENEENEESGESFKLDFSCDSSVVSVRSRINESVMSHNHESSLLNTQSVQDIDKKVPFIVITF